MPVSRKRKSRKSKSGPKPRRVTLPGIDGSAAEELARAFAGLADYRQQRDERRAGIAAEIAGPLVADLVELAPGRSDDDLEDELCRRIGSRLWAMDGLSPDDSVGPETLGEAILAAADEAVRRALDTTADPQAPWRVLTVVARILPYPLRQNADDLTAGLTDAPGELLRAPDRREVAGQVLWARDAYGSRFAIAAPFASADGPDHWYLWDVDACGFKAFTVHSGFYPTHAQALAKWRAGVGEIAAGATDFTPADDPALVADLLFREDGILRAGGEHEPHLAEYLRGRRLAEAVVEAIGPVSPTPPPLDAERAAEQFAAWMRSHRTPPAELDELATELATSWSLDAPEALYGTCSPHRVALTVIHLRDYYQDDYAAELVALLPDWASWLAERNGTPPELADRCRPYASGEPHPGISVGDKGPDFFAQVIE
jgi:hypothetical protein